MPSDSYRPSSARAIILGIIAFIILMAIICGLAEVLKFAGSPFLILPEKFGWIPDVSRKDVTAVDMQMNNIQLSFDRTGDYVVYAYDYDLLMVTDELARANANPWLKIINANDGNSIKPDFVQRALTPFDSSNARGRPIFHFVIPESGTYNISFPKRYAIIYFLPDQVTGRFGIIIFSFLLQITIIGIPLAALIRKQYRKRQAKLDEIRNLKKPTNDQFWQELKRQRESQRGSPKP